MLLLLVGLSASEKSAGSVTQKLSAMASLAARVSFRIAVAVLLLILLFYVGRPLYWKISATVHDIRHNKQTVKQGLSQIVYEAQKSVGWFHDESDSGVADDRKARGAAAAARRLLHVVISEKMHPSAIDMPEYAAKN